MFQVLTLKDGNDENGTEVQLQDKKGPFHILNRDQEWQRKWWKGFDSKYFVLIERLSFPFAKRLLTAEGTEKLYIGGKLCTKYLLNYVSFIASAGD